jgi:DNA adenine methylase
MSDLMKWSGSKDSQAKNIISYFPKKIAMYFEPFLGGGSMFLQLLESDIKVNYYILGDVNEELIGVYKLIQEEPKVLISAYKTHYDNFNSSDIQHRKDYFAKIRTQFNKNKNPEDFYWIMRTTTNGMPRYNKKGEFNNSCHFSRPGMKPEEVEKIIMKYHNLMKFKYISFGAASYKEMSKHFQLESFEYDNYFMYCDPPYENTKGMYFGGFNNKEFITWLNNLKCNWALSYDGKVNEDKVNHVAPNYKRHEYLLSGNSSFRRVIGNSNDSIISESLYLNF